MTPEMISKITECTITVIILIVSAYVIPFLKNKIGTDKMQLLQEFTETCVRAAEQLYTPEDWKFKKEYVTKLVSEKANDLGIGLNEAEIDAVIEGIVNYVKHNKANGG
ncbi:MAG: phage holin [Lachnospiraceae bacterium]|nr:phage holin [Lachnospiraceae bacterium]